MLLLNIDQLYFLSRLHLVVFLSSILQKLFYICMCKSLLWTLASIRLALTHFIIWTLIHHNWEHQNLIILILSLIDIAEFKGVFVNVERATHWFPRPMVVITRTIEIIETVSLAFDWWAIAYYQTISLCLKWISKGLPDFLRTQFASTLSFCLRKYILCKYDAIIHLKLN